VNDVLLQYDFTELVPRIFKCGDTQNTSFTTDEELNILINETLVCVIAYTGVTNF